MNKYAGGSSICGLVSVAPEFDQDGQVTYVQVVTRDITDRKRAEEELRLAASVFANANEGIAVANVDSRILDVNAAFARITGYAREEVIGKSPSLFWSWLNNPESHAELWRTLQQTGRWAGERWDRRKNGEAYAVLLTISAVKNEHGNVSHFVGVFTDITEIKKHEQQLERIAHYDALTGVPNRLLFMDRLKQAMAQAQRSGGFLAVCYGDLDGFKPVNDFYGLAGVMKGAGAAQRTANCSVVTATSKE